MRISILVLVLLLVTVSIAEKDYTDFVKYLKAQMSNSNFKYSAYNRLAYIVDTYGARLWGSNTLELVIQEMQKQAKAQGFDNVHLQAVKNFTKWVRGNESLTLYSPRPEPTKLNVIGLGGTVGGDVRANVIVVKDYDELEQMKAKVPGNIVCFNNKWVDYYTSVQYRVNGASMAAKYGAKAMLVRSVASESISSVHTGYMEYNTSYPKIPCAAITVQDAQMFQRMQARNQTITVRLQIDDHFQSGANSNNLIFEIKGSLYPDQIVLAGGHIDSWDTGSQTGANDDGGGFITVFQAYRLIYKLGFRPKRTLRFIAWSGEQSGSDRDGAAQYLQTHTNELNKHVAAFESDLGSSKLYGFGHTGKGTDIFKGILAKYMSLLGASDYSDDGFSVDVEPLYDKGVPVIKNLIQDTPDHNYYFRYHHSAGDSMTMMNPDDMDSNVVGIAALLYIIADLDTTLRDVRTDNLRMQ